MHFIMNSKCNIGSSIVIVIVYQRTLFPSTILKQMLMLLYCLITHLKYKLYFVTPETVLRHSWWSFPLCTPHVSVPWCSWSDICIIAVENDHFPRTARWHLPPWPSGSSHFTWTVHTCCSHYFPIFQSFCDLRWLVPSCFLNPTK